MAASKRKKLEVLTIECGWNSCGQEFDNNWDLNTHIEQHLSKYKPKNPKSGTHICLWVNCDFDTDCIKEFHRHMYFHGYYEDLLVQGKHVCDTHPSVPKCTAMEMTTYRIPALKEDFRCQWTDCERTFSSVVEFQDHIVQHASFEYEIQKSPDDERPKTQCNWHFCHKQLENKYRLIEHIRTHTNKKQLACYNCGETFRTKTTLFDHLKRQPENNTQNYQCAQCYKYFATERLLKLHVIKHVNCYKCTMCDMTCSSASSLATHIRYRHLKDKPFECDLCNHRCVRKSDLARHKQNVHSKELHSCAEPGCQYTVKSYEQMRRHFLEVHADNPYIYACHCCEKCFKNGKSLSQHLMKTHDFQLPSGHKRFTYRVDENGIYRLETMRIESLEVSQQILTPNPFDPKKAQNTAFEIKNLTKTGDAERIVLTNGTKEPLPISEIVISLPNMVEL